MTGFFNRLPFAQYFSSRQFLIITVCLKIIGLVINFLDRHSSLFFWHRITKRTDAELARLSYENVRLFHRGSSRSYFRLIATCPRMLRYIYYTFIVLRARDATRDYFSRARCFEARPADFSRQIYLYRESHALVIDEYKHFY